MPFRCDSEQQPVATERWLDDCVTTVNGWKEIAAYLARGVRTAQRWESTLGLPVRRPRATDRGAVLAIPSEISQWLKRAPARTAANFRNHVPSTDLVIRACELLEQGIKVLELHENSQVKDLIKSLRETVHQLTTVSQSKDQSGHPEV